MSYVEAWLDRLAELYTSALANFKEDGQEAYISAAISAPKTRESPITIRLATDLHDMFAGKEQLVQGLLGLEDKKSVWLEVGPDDYPSDNAFLQHIKETCITDLYATVLEDMMTRFVVCVCQPPSHCNPGTAHITSCAPYCGH